MNAFATVKKTIIKKNIPFEEVTFTDHAISARLTDTSVDKNYNPDNAIKTLILSSKDGFVAVILKGSDKIDQTKLKVKIGKWNIVDAQTLETIFQFLPGTICPLVLDIPFLIDTNAMNLSIWSMGAGEDNKGINVKKDDCINKLFHFEIVDLAVTSENNQKHGIVKGGTMDAIENLLMRGVESIYPNREALEKVLRSGKKLRLYQGFDPSGTQFHIGHAVGLRKLRQWQDLGHHVIFLIGDGTGQAGDPSGKTRSREKFLTNAELRQNAKDYVLQAKKIVRFEGVNPAEILYNGDWLNKLTLVDILDIAGRISFQQMAERDLYQERVKAGETLSLREFFYPLLQGYDSVAMKVDLELGGSDQLFNMLMGRQLVKSMQNREKFVMTVPLLTDAKGTKIGKTEGNVIGLTDAPVEFYAKIMSLGDDSIIPCLTLLTDTPMEDIENMKRKMKAGDNPMTFKKQLAFGLTKQLNDENSAQKAQKEFETVHQKGTTELVSAPTVEIKLVDSIKITDALVALSVVSSKSEAKRLVEQNAIEVDNVVAHLPIKEGEQVSGIKNGSLIRIGKKKFVKVKII